MNRIVSSLAFVAVLIGVPATAMADHGAPSAPRVDVGVTPGSLEVHVHGNACGHEHDRDDDRWRDRDSRDEYQPSARVVRRPGGFYELRAVDVWVPAQVVEEVTPQQCREHGGKHRKVKCWGGYTTTRVIPAHYEAREQWVWVETAPRPRGYVRARW